jgi:hypothetical protein
MRWVMAAKIIASLVCGSRSWSTSSRRYRTSQPKVRSTTHHRGWIWNPPGASSSPASTDRAASTDWADRRADDRRADDRRATAGTGQVRC